MKRIKKLESFLYRRTTKRYSAFEFFYSDLDEGFFRTPVQKPQDEGKKNPKPRRFSQAFIAAEHSKLEEYRTALRNSPYSPLPRIKEGAIIDVFSPHSHSVISRATVLQNLSTTTKTLLVTFSNDQKQKQYQISDNSFRLVHCPESILTSSSPSLHLIPGTPTKKTSFSSSSFETACNPSLLSTPPKRQKRQTITRIIQQNVLSSPSKNAVSTTEMQQKHIEEHKDAKEQQQLGVYSPLLSPLKKIQQQQRDKLEKESKGDEIKTLAMSISLLKQKQLLLEHLAFLHKKAEDLKKTYCQQQQQQQNQNQSQPFVFPKWFQGIYAWVIVKIDEVNKQHLPYLKHLRDSVVNKVILSTENRQFVPEIFFPLQSPLIQNPNPNPPTQQAIQCQPQQIIQPKNPILLNEQQIPNSIKKQQQVNELLQINQDIAKSLLGNAVTSVDCMSENLQTVAINSIMLVISLREISSYIIQAHEFSSLIPSSILQPIRPIHASNIQLTEEINSIIEHILSSLKKSTHKSNTTST